MNEKVAQVLQKGKEIAMPICLKCKTLALQGYAKGNEMMDKVSFLQKPLYKKIVWGAMGVVALWVVLPGIGESVDLSTPEGVAIASLRAYTNGDVLEWCKYSGAPTQTYAYYEYTPPEDEWKEQRLKDARDRLEELKKAWLDLGLKGCSIKPISVEDGSSEYEKFVTLEVSHKGEKFRPTISLHKGDNGYKTCFFWLNRDE